MFAVASPSGANVAGPVLAAVGFSICKSPGTNAPKGRPLAAVSAFALPPAAGRLTL